MYKTVRLFFVSLGLAATCFAGVTISSPAPGSTSTSPVHFVASASSSAPISSMQIYVDNVSVFMTNSSSLDTLVTMSAGSHNVVVQAWDSTGAVFKAPETISVTAAAGAVAVSSPANNATVSSPFQVSASASAPNPITAMQIYLDNQLVFSASAASLNTEITAVAGTHLLVVQAWDSTGAVYKSSENINVTTPTGTVAVSSPANNASVTSPFQVAASASGPNPITAMQIYLDNQLLFTANAASLNTQVNAGLGSHLLVVQAWDSTGAVVKQSLTVNINAVIPSNATVKSQIEDMGGWQSCTVCAGANGSGPSAIFSMQQFQASPSLDNSSAKFNISGSTPYADALWWNQLGPSDSATNFVYDLNFYLTDPQAPQALEFDVNQSIGNLKFIFGTQCAMVEGAWDVWDAPNGRWQSTGVACTRPAAFTWHHLAWQLRRSSTQTIFVAFTLDGVTHNVNLAFNAIPVSADELNVAFQMDLNFAAQAYSVWLDKVTLSYW